MPVAANRLYNNRIVKKMAERVGFEPTVPAKARRISSAVHSTTLPPLRGAVGRLVERAASLMGDGLRRKRAGEKSLSVATEVADQGLRRCSGHRR